MNIKMQYLKTWKLFESNNDLLYEAEDILQELKDIGLLVSINMDWRGPLEIRISKRYDSSDRVVPDLPTPPGGKYPGNLFFWFEVKETIIRLNNWYLSFKKDFTQNNKISIFRIFTGNIEFGTGFKEEDFERLNDSISFTSLTIQIKL
jgi:hypothetical protein